MSMWPGSFPGSPVACGAGLGLLRLLRLKYSGLEVRYAKISKKLLYPAGRLTNSWIFLLSCPRRDDLATIEEICRG